MKEVVSFEIAKFIYCAYQYKNDTAYMYDLSGKIHLSLEPEYTYLIPAPTIQEAVNFLWRMGIKIYYAPKKEKCIPLIMIEQDVTELRELCDTPEESYNLSLCYLAKLFKQWRKLKGL